MRAFVFLLHAISVLCWQSYQNDIPNGRNVMYEGQPWAGVGHEARQGGGPRNIFGLRFKAEGHTWTQALCTEDTDNDGRSNGEELGDPDCEWTKGATPSRSTGITHPAFPDDPPGVDTASPTSTQTASPTLSPADPADRFRPMKIRVHSGFYITWQLSENGSSATITAEFTRKNQEFEWFAVGFHETGNLQMTGSEAIIATEASSGATEAHRYMLNGRSTDQVVRTSDSSDFTDQSISCEGQTCTMTFTKSLNPASGIEISDLEQVSLLWALGNSPDLTYHAVRGSASYDFTRPQPDIPDEPVDPGEPDELELTEGATLRFTVNDDQSKVTFTMTHETDQFVWVGIGFNRDGTASMVPAQSVIATAGDEVKAYSMTARTTPEVADDMDDIEDYSVTHSDGLTTFTFTKLVDVPEGSSGVSLTDLENVPLIWAIGPASTLPNNHHPHKGAATLNVLTGGGTAAGNRMALLYLHLFCMIIAWGWFLNAGIEAAIFGKGKSYEENGYKYFGCLCKVTNWFKWHKYCNITGYFLALLGVLFMAIRNNFTFTPRAHTVLGLIITVIMALQPLNAFFRGNAEDHHNRTTKRIVFEWVHKSSGHVALLLAYINILLGLLLVQANLVWIIVGIIAIAIDILYLSYGRWLLMKDAAEKKSEQATGV